VVIRANFTGFIRIHLVKLSVDSMQGDHFA
jgi:hypothetical protein